MLVTEVLVPLLTVQGLLGAPGGSQNEAQRPDFLELNLKEMKSPQISQNNNYFQLYNNYWSFQLLTF